MAVSVTCPGCGTSYPIAEDLLGKKIRCKKCQETFAATAAKVGAVRAADERIQAKPAVRTTGRGADDDDAPRKGRKPVGTGAYVIGGGVAGLLVLVLGGAAFWAFSGGGDKPKEDTARVAPPPRVELDLPGAAPKADAAKAADNPVATLENTIRKHMRSGPRPARIPSDVLERVKKSAVFIRVTTTNSISEGSGWFAEPGIIITNSHVVGMKEPAQPPPDRIEVIIDSGIEGRERSMTAQILALDRYVDLAVLQVKGHDLPEPLPIAPTADLREQDRLLVMGFPLGSSLKGFLGLAKQAVTTVKVREAVVSGRLSNKDGSVWRITLEGGADHGNSGGAVLDTNGNVAGVLVEGLGDFNSNLRFIIPSEYVTYLLKGRVLGFQPGQAYASGSGIKQPLLAKIADPMQRIRTVALDVWAGLPGTVRPASERQPAPEPGDSNHQTIALNYDPAKKVALGEAQVAQADVDLPALKEGQAYWIQPRYVTKDGPEYWGEAVVLKAGHLPVERKPANLTVVHKPNTTRQLQLTSRAAFAFEVNGNGGAGELSLTADMTEQVRTLNKDGSALVRLRYKDLHFTDADMDTMVRKALRGVMESAKGMMTDVTVTKDGRVTAPRPDLANVSPLAQPPLRLFNEHMVQSLDFMAIPLPNKQVQPGETWDIEANIFIANVFNSKQQEYQSALLHVTCKYLGVRTRNGRSEAVLELNGRVSKDKADAGPSGGGSLPPGEGRDEGSSEDRKKTIKGFAHGAALVDLATGSVSLGRTLIEVNVDLPYKEDLTVRASGLMDMQLQRPAAGAPVKEPKWEDLLPNQQQDYNPLIVADASASSGVEPAVAPPAEKRIRPEVLDRVKKSAVLIRVSRDEGNSDGSGWFAAPGGYVVTNAHVVGLEEPLARPPEKIEVVVHSGDADQQVLPARLLTVDRTDDLAVLKVEGDNLPEPLPVVPSAALREEDRLLVVGFPFGTDLNRIMKGGGLNEFRTAATARETTVAGRITNVDGSVKYVQVEAGSDPGSSGSAVIDMNGNVRAVDVAGAPHMTDLNAQKSYMKFVIPGEYAKTLLEGCPLEVQADELYLAGSDPRQVVKVRFGDPLRQVKKASLDYWTGAPDKPRLPSDKLPEALPGDSARQTAELSYDAAKQLAKGEFSLPTLPAGQVYWFQTRYANEAGPEHWGEAKSYVPSGPPVKHEPQDLIVRHKLNSNRRIDLTSKVAFHSELLGQEAYAMDLRAVLTEQVYQIDRAKHALARLSFTELTLGGDPHEDPPRRRALRQLLDSKVLVGVVNDVVQAKDGKLTQGRLLALPQTVSASGQVLAALFNKQLFSSLQALSVPLPNKKVEPGYTWEVPTQLFLNPTGRRNQAALFKVKYKYVGWRTRGGRREAVLQMEGTVSRDPNAPTADPEAPASEGDDQATGERPTKPKGADKVDVKSDGKDAPLTAKTLYGFARGHAFVDLDDGQVSLSRAYIDLSVELPASTATLRDQGMSVRADGTMDLQMQRSATGR